MKDLLKERLRTLFRHRSVLCGRGKSFFEGAGLRTFVFSRKVQLRAYGVSRAEKGRGVKRGVEGFNFSTGDDGMSQLSSRIDFNGRNWFLTLQSLGKIYFSDHCKFSSVWGREKVSRADIPWKGKSLVIAVFYGW